MPPQRAADARRERALRAVVLARVPPSHFDRTLRVDLQDRRLVEACVEIKFYGAFAASTSTPSTGSQLDGVAL